jgi:nucleoside-diphosphate-sugar epimerase
MVVVAVAGGSGDMGRLIVDALLQREKHEVYVFLRKLSTYMYLNIIFPFFIMKLRLLGTDLAH